MSDTTPKDLQTTPQPDTDKNYFNFKATGLKIDTNYAIKFQWVYADGTVSDWSPGKFINTSTEVIPGSPSAAVPSTATGSIPVTLSVFPTNAKRVDVYVINGIFGTGKVAHSFSSAGTTTIAAPAGTYQVQLITVTPSGINGTPSETFTITIADVGETIQAPTNPNGFSIVRVLGGIQVNWAGTYANGTFTGFEAIKIYVGNSAVATSGTYTDAGVMTGNNVVNTITIPVDGTYLRYNLPVYVHAAAVNKNGVIGTIQANVASDLLGAKTAVASDLADQIITNAKLVDDAVSAAKIATSAITTTKIADDAITTPKLVANAITADKIVSSAITADKIATNAITATKILAGTIDVSKLAAGTISTNNLESGIITATSYLRAGTKNVAAGTGSRIEISSSLIEDGVVDIAAGFYIYNSEGTAILSAPLNGGLSIVGGGTFSGNLSAAGGTFTGTLSAATGSFSGTVTASSGSIGNWVINSGKLASAAGSNPAIELDPLTPQIVIRGSSSNITLAPTTGITAGSTFSVTPAGYLTSSSGSIAGWTVTSSSISKTSSYPDIFGTTATLTTTLGSDAKITVSSSNAPYGFVNLGIDSAIVTENANQKIEIGPNGLGFVNKTLNLGIRSGYMRMWTNSGDSDFNIYWDGWRSDAEPQTYAPFQWRWLNYSTSAERLTHIASITYDLLPQSLRPLVVDTDGRQYLGANSYFSTTQTTTPSAGTGSNGDFYYSTA